MPHKILRIFLQLRRIHIYNTEQNERRNREAEIEERLNKQQEEIKPGISSGWRVNAIPPQKTEERQILNDITYLWHIE